MSTTEKTRDSSQTPSMLASLLVFGVMIGLILLSVFLFPEEVDAGTLQISMTLTHQMFTKAKAEGKPVQFSNHQPNYYVDLNSIPPVRGQGCLGACDGFAGEKLSPLDQRHPVHRNYKVRFTHTNR